MAIPVIEVLRGKHAVRDESRHAKAVDAWLEATARGLSADGWVRLLDAALSALWGSTEVTLGEATLTAIAERVLYDVVQRFPTLGALEVDQDAGFQCAELQQSAHTVPPAELEAGVRFVVVEFLTVLGAVTAEILTPTLHAALARVSPPQRSSEGGPK